MSVSQPHLYLPFLPFLFASFALYGIGAVFRGLWMEAALSWTVFLGGLSLTLQLLHSSEIGGSVPLRALSEEAINEYVRLLRRANA